jgi:hypothetical protein
MHKPAAITLALLVLSLSACTTYDTVRMAEREKCAAMPASQSASCYERTAMTKSQYDARRRELKRELEEQKDQPADSRYSDWVP